MFNRRNRIEQLIRRAILYNISKGTRGIEEYTLNYYMLFVAPFREKVQKWKQLFHNKCSPEFESKLHGGKRQKSMYNTQQNSEEKR
jgi:hypothetical protein